MKEWDILVLNVYMPQLQQGILGHILKVTHEGVRYPCPECKYAATQKGALKKTFRK